MASGLGILKWTPADFWQATFYEYTAAMKGHLVSQGADPEPPMSRDEFLSLKAEDEKTKRMPDA
jgi:hypothetical protein